MVDYASDEVMPFPRERIWQLLDDHLDEEKVARIHPRITRQSTVSRDASSIVLARSIDARGRLLRSRWRITARPPDTYRWEILEGEGPYATGSWMESSYTEEARGTRVRSEGRLRLTVVPFLLPQGPVIRRVLDSIDAEDRRYLGT